MWVESSCTALWFTLTLHSFWCHTEQEIDAAAHWVVGNWVVETDHVGLVISSSKPPNWNDADYSTCPPYSKETTIIWTLLYKWGFLVRNTLNTSILEALYGGPTLMSEVLITVSCSGRLGSVHFIFHCEERKLSCCEVSGDSVLWVALLGVMIRLYNTEQGNWGTLGSTEDSAKKYATFLALTTFIWPHGKKKKNNILNVRWPIFTSIVFRKAD